MRNAILFAGKHFNVVPLDEKHLTMTKIRQSSTNGQSFYSGNMHTKVPEGADVYISTYSSRLVDDYIQLYNPVKTLILPETVQRQTIAEGLKMIDPSQYDMITITRCDIFMTIDWPEPATEPSFFSWEQDRDGKPKVCADGRQGVSDIFWSFPVQYYDEILDYLLKTEMPLHLQAMHCLPSELPSVPFTVYYDEIINSGTKYLHLMRLKTVSQTQMNLWS